MAEDLGTIYYEVDAKTDGLVNSELELQASSRKTQAELKKTEQAVKSMNTQMTKTAKGVKTVNTAMQSVGKKAGQAGIQIQQLVGQLQGGQNAAQAFAAQGADLGIVLGAPMTGVIFALGAAIVGTLIPALAGANEEMKSIADNTDDFFERVQARLDATGQDTQLQANIITVESAKIAKQYEKNLVSIQNYRNEAALLNRAALAGDKTSRQLAASLRDQADELERENQVLAETAERLFMMGIEMKTFQGFTDEGSESAIKFKDATTVLSEAIKAQVIGIAKGADALEEYRIRQALGITEAEKLPDVINEQLIALRKLRAEQEKRKADSKALADEQKQEEQFRRELEAQERRLMTGEQKLKDSLQRERDIINQAREQGLIDEQEYRNRQRAIAEQYFTGIAAMQQEVNTKGAESNDMLARSFESFANQAAGAFTRVLVGASTGREAISQLANAILNEAVGAIVRLGFQYITTNGLIETADTARKAANATAYSTSIGAQVAATAALAAQNAFAATAAIPIVGPGLAPAAAASAGATASALGSPAIAAAPVAGARQYGGSVEAGKTYQVNEAGTEGLLQSVGGRQYLTPLGNGRVIPANQMPGAMGAGGVVVNIENTFSAADVQATQTGENEVMIRIAQREANKVKQDLTRQMKTNTGAFYKATVTGTSLKGRSTR